MICINHISFIICILFIIIFYFYGLYNQQIKQFSGFYESDNKFNEESGISLFSFYINNNCNYNYNGYLLMVSNDNIPLINEKVDFCISSNLYHNMNDILCKGRNLKFNIKFNNLETNLIPNNLYMDFYPITNKLILYDNTKIYAVFFKNPVLSEIEQISKEKNLYKKENKIKTKKEIEEFEDL